MWDSTEGRPKMFCRLLFLVFFGSLCWSPADSRVIQKRAAFYIANETMCIVDGEVYRNGDPVPTDDECERCTCRPPGFSCVLRDCDTKPGCKAVRKVGECCPEYVCGCVHNSRLYEDGELIRDLQNNCYTCRCHGSSISCTFADCQFRGDCPPEYIAGECCPRYDHCPPASTTTTTTTTTTEATTPHIVQQEIEFLNLTTQHVEKFTSEDTTVTIQDIHKGDPYFTTSPDTPKETLFTVKFTLSGEKISSIKDFDTTELTTILPRQTVGYTETTRHIVTLPGSELTSLKHGLVAGDLETTTSDISSSSDFHTDDELTTRPSDIYSQKGGLLSTTESEKPEDVTEHEIEMSESDDTLVSTDDGHKITTLQEAEDSSFDSGSRISTVKHDESADSLRPIFVTADADETNETTTHGQDNYSETEPHISSGTDQDSDPAPHEGVTTSTGYTDSSTSSDISADDFLDSKSVATTHLVSTIGEETTAEQSETHQTTESATHGDLQTSSDELHAAEDILLSHTLHSTTLDSDDFHTDFDHSESDQELASTTDLIIEGAEILHSTADSESLSSEHDTDHEPETTGTVSAEEHKTTPDGIITLTDGLEDVTSGQDGETTDSSHDIHEETEETLKYEDVSPDTSGSAESDLHTSVPQETVSETTPDTSLQHGESTGIFDTQSTLDSESSTSQSEDTSDTEETSNDTFKTEEITGDHTPSVVTEKTGSTDDVETTTDQHASDISVEELDSSSADLVTSVQQSDTLATDTSTFTDHHPSSGHDELSTTFDETPSTISDLTSVSFKQDLTTDSNSFTEASEITSTISNEDVSSQSSDSLNVEENGTSDNTRYSESSGITDISTAEFNTNNGEDTSAGDEVTESDIEHEETKSEDLSPEIDESVNNLSTLELSESEELSTSVLSPSSESEEPVSSQTDEDTASSSIETLKSATLNPADSEKTVYTSQSGDETKIDSVSTTDIERSTVSVLTTERDNIYDHDVTDSDGNIEILTETEAANDSHPTDESEKSVDVSYTSPEDSFQEGEISKAETESTAHTVTLLEDNTSHTEEGHSVTSADEHETDGDSSSKVTDLSSQPTTVEIKSVEVDETDTLHVKHDTEMFATKGTTTAHSEPLKVTSLKPLTEQSPTTTESGIPSEILAFEPPLANILKQQMMFKRPTAEKENASVSILSDDLQKEKINFTRDSTDENQLVRLSLTLADENNENINYTTLTHDDSENKIFVLNHEYTISDSEVSDVETSVSDDADNIQEETEHTLSSVTKENGEHAEVTSNEQTTTVGSTDHTSTTKDHAINTIPIYSENDESVPSISGTELLDSKDLLTETTGSENITPGIIKDLNLLSDTLETHALSQDQNSANAINLQNIDDNLSEEHSTTDSQKTYTPETSDYTENPRSFSENDNEEVNTDTDLLVPSTTDTVVENNSQFESTENIGSEKSHENHDEEFFTRSQISSVPPFESTTGKENDDATVEDIGVGSEVVEHTFTSSDDDSNNHYDDNSESTTEVNEASSKSHSDQSDDVTNDELISTESSDVIKDSDLSHNKTIIDYSYHDAETAESSEDDKSTPTGVSIHDLDPEMITALQEISTSLIANFSDILNSSSPVDSEYDDLSTTPEEKDSETLSAVKILFGQNSHDIWHKTTETDLSATQSKEDFSSDFHFHNNKDILPQIDTEETKSDETSDGFTETEHHEHTQNFNENSHAEDFEPSNTPTDQTENSKEDKTDVDFHESSNITPDSGETTRLEENGDLQSESSVKLNLANFSDEAISPGYSSNDSKIEAGDIISEAEEASSPFTILEYIGDLFSGFSTFSTVSDSNEGISTEEATDISDKGKDSTHTPTDSTSGTDMTLSPNQIYSQNLKNQFAEYGSLGGVFITGQSKYNKSSSDSKPQEPGNDSLDILDDITNSSVTDNSDELIPHNSDNNFMAEIGSDQEAEHLATEESNRNEEFITAVGDRRQSTLADDTQSESFSTTISDEKSEHNEEASSLEPGVESTDDTFITASEAIKGDGPEKGGEWFEPSDPFLSPSNNETDQNSVADHKAEDHLITTDIPGDRGPEKGGDVFEPAFPEIFPIGSEHSETNNDKISDNAKDELSATENVVEEVSTQNNVLGTSKFTSSEPDSAVATSTKNPFEQKFVPPLPIWLKDFDKSGGQNNSSVNDQDNVSNAGKSDHNLDVDHLSGEESALTSSKIEYARNINHPFLMSDVISQVFKAPGYDSEIHLSPWRGITPQKKSQFLRVKRDTKDPYEKEHTVKTEDISSYVPSKSTPENSPVDDINPINNKNILLVEGYGQKPASFFPVTSSFIIVHSDEDSEDNETDVDSKKKIAPPQPKVQISEVEFLDEIPPQSPEKEVSLSGVGKTHQTK